MSDILCLSVGCPLKLSAIDAVLAATGDTNVCFYGAPKNFALDGGRVVEDSRADFDVVLSQLRERGVAFNLCCNTVLDEGEVDFDATTWEVIESAYAPLNGIIVARHWVAEKIRKRFPHFHLYFSSIGALCETWDEPHLFSHYDIVVCPANRTNDFALIKQLEHWGKLEVFLNNECISFGSQCFEHYRHNSELNNGKMPEIGFRCPNVNRHDANVAPLQPSFSDLLRYVSLGVRRFKVIERTAEGQDYSNHFQLLRAVAATMSRNP